MFNTSTKPTSGIIYFNDGSEMTFKNILSAEVEMETGYGRYKDATVTLNLGQDLHGETFTLNIPSERKKEEEVNTNFYLITVRFMSRPGCYKFNTKLYDYYITAELKNSLVNRLGIGSEIKILGKSGEELYSGNKLRVENIMGFETLEDAKLVSGIEELKEIKNLVVLGEYRLDLSSNFPKYSIYKNKTYYNDIEAEKYWNMCSYFLPPANESKTNKQPVNNKQELYVNTANTEPLYYVVNTDNNKNITTTEEKNMSKNMFGNMFKNMKFGLFNSQSVKYSFNGIAFKTSDGDYVTYNDDFTFTNVADMIIDMPIFAMPVSREQISVGDVIRHNDTWVIVNEVSDTEIKVAKPWTKEIVTVIPETSIFGFSFYTKIINPFEGLGKEANADNPFGNILPFLMMQNDGSDSMNPMMMAMMFGGGKIDMSNPMMMYMMMSQNKEIDPMMMMLMMGNNPFAPKQEKITEDKIDSMIDSGLIKKLYEKISNSLNETNSEKEVKGE